MADKKGDTLSVREKAQQMRLEQDKADKRTRTIIIALVVVVVIAVVAAVGIVIWQQVAKQRAVANADPAAVLGDYASGAPIVVSHLGVGQKDESLPTLTEYFDYSCHACADIDVLAGNELSRDVADGKYNIEYQPVTTVDMGYMHPATTASLVVAQKDPEHWEAFHHSLLSYFSTQYNAGKGQVIQNREASWKQVKVLAKEVGVPDKVIESIPQNVTTDYLEASTTAWRNAAIENRGDKLGTPEFVKDHSTRIDLSGADAQTLVSIIRAGIGVE